MAQLKSTSVTGNLSVTGNILASKIIKLGGTADQILLANGDIITKSALSGQITNNTTYTFESGTNCFYVTPSDGFKQTVNVTPSITNNITGSGTSGYIAKFNGTNSITSGPAFGTDTTKFLNNKGEWAVPSDTDTKVTQSNTTTANWHKVILSKQNSATMGAATTETTDVVYVTPKIEAQPSTGSLRMTGNMLLHNPDGGDSPKLVFQRGDEKGNVTDWNMYVQSGALKINSIPTSNSTTEKNIAEFAYNGGLTIYSPGDSSGVETASMTIQTSNGGQLIIGKEGPNSGTMLRFDQTTGTTRLRFRASSSAGAMVWEQPESNSGLYLDVNNVYFRNTTGIILSHFKSAGYLYTDSSGNLKSAAFPTIPTVPNITITDTTDATTKPIVGDITANGHTITVSRIGLNDLGLASAYKYQGSLANLAAIEAVSNPVSGDVYNAQDTGMNYAWNGSAWDALGWITDLSSFVTGSGTANYIPKFTAAGTIGNSVITQSDKNDITVAGKLIVQSNGSTSANSYNEGIRVLPAANGWSELFFSNNQTTSSTHANGWILGKRGAAGATSGAAGDFTIECNGSGGTGLTLYANGSRPRWNNNELAYKSDFGSGGSMDLSQYLPLAGNTTSTLMTGSIKYGGATQEIISLAPEYDNGSWKGGMKYSWDDKTTIALWGRNTNCQFVWHAGADLSTGATNGWTKRDYDFQVGRNSSNVLEALLGGKPLATQEWVTDEIPPVNNGKLTLNTTGPGISGSAEFTANQSGGSTFTVTLNSSPDGNRDANKVVVSSAQGTINSAKYTITKTDGVAKASWQYNDSTDCVELVW